jgi:hypothetical protein
LSHSSTGSLSLSDLKKLAFNIGFIVKMYHLWYVLSSVEWAEILLLTFDDTTGARTEKGQSSTPWSGLELNTATSSSHTWQQKINVVEDV